MRAATASVLLARGCRSTFRPARRAAQPELAHEVGERVREGAADEPCNYLRRLRSRRRPAAMTQRAESEDGAETLPQQPRVHKEASGFGIQYGALQRSVRVIESFSDLQTDFPERHHFR